MGDTRRWRFGRFEADAAEHRLWCDGRVIAITPKSFALLVALLERAGQLVTKAELFETVWAGRPVSDAALARALRELRAALGDDAAHPSCIETAHGIGLRFVAPVEKVAAAPSRAAAATSARLPGREAELDALTQASLRPLQAAGSSCSSPGPRASARPRSSIAALVASPAPHWLAAGRCIEQYGPAEAYLPLREALERLAGQAGAAAMREHLLRVAPGWLAQLPWLAHDVAHGALEQALAGQSQARLLREFAQALEMLARERLVVLWIEDLHWCDRSSLDALVFLAGRRETAQLLVVGSLRPPQAPDAPVQRLVLELLSRSGGREIALAPLARESVRDLVRLRLPNADRVSAELGALVHRRSQGNPLFARAITDDLLAGGELVNVAGGWALARSESEIGRSLPETLRQLVDSQLAALAEEDRRVVEAAAVAGAAFSAAAVAAAVQADAIGIEDRCARLTGAGGFFATRDNSVWPDGSISSGYAFVHSLYHAAVLERVPRDDSRPGIGASASGSNRRSATRAAKSRPNSRCASKPRATCPARSSTCALPPRQHWCAARIARVWTCCSAGCGSRSNCRRSMRRKRRRRR